MRWRTAGFAGAVLAATACSAGPGVRTDACGAADDIHDATGGAGVDARVVVVSRSRPPS